MSFIHHYAPVTNWLPAYRPAWLTADIFAGITIWGMLVPEGIAYAGLAGAPAQAGLYTLIVSLAAYALLGTSRQLVCAATSSTSIMIGAVMAPLIVDDPSRYGALLAALVLVVGFTFLAAGMMRLGFIATFISKPVMTGFVFGLALYIAVHQLPKLFGVSRGEGDTWQQLWHIGNNLGAANWTAFALGAAAIAGLFTVGRLLRRVPAALLTMILGILAVSLLDLGGSHGVAIVGDIPAGLPSLASPDISASDILNLLPGALSIALVGFSEALGASKTLAGRHNYAINVNQELVAYGAANLGSSLLGGMVACSSMSTSEVNDDAGAKSELSTAVAFLLVLLTILFLTPLFKNLPEAVLGAIVIYAVIHLMRVGEMRRYYRLGRAEFWLALVALVGVLTVNIVPGLLIAVVLSLLLLIWRASRPVISHLGMAPDAPGVYTSLARHPGNRAIPGLVVLRFDAPLFFANAEEFRDEVRALLVGPARPRALLIDLHSCDGLDISSADALMQLADEARRAEVELMFAEVIEPVRETLLRSGLIEKLGPEQIFDTVDEGVKHFLSEPLHTRSR